MSERRRKVIQIAINQTQFFALCDDGSIWSLVPPEGGPEQRWRPFDVHGIEYSDPVFPGRRQPQRLADGVGP